MWLQVINKVKVTHQGEGCIKVKVKYLHPFKFYVAHGCSLQAGGLHSTEMLLVSFINTLLFFIMTQIYQCPGTTLFKIMQITYYM